MISNIFLHTMKRIDILMIVLLLGVVAWMSYTHEGYDEVNDIGQWRTLNDGEREWWYLRIGDAIYGNNLDIKGSLRHGKPLKIDAKSLRIVTMPRIKIMYIIR